MRWTDTSFRQQPKHRGTNIAIAALLLAGVILAVLAR